MTTEERFEAEIKESTWAEWVGGRVIRTRELSSEHAEARMFAMHLLGGFVDEHDLGTVYPRVQVRFADQRSRRQPDMIVVATANADRVRQYHVEGPPDLICEVVADGSRTRDRVEKFAEYEAAGVPEYWLLDPPAGEWDAYTLGAAGRYVRVPEVDGEVRSVLLPGLFFRPAWVRQPDYPRLMPLFRSMARRRRTLLSTPPPSLSDNPET